MKPTDRQWILMQIPFEPFPPLSGNSQRILALLAFLKRYYRIALVLPQPSIYSVELKTYCDEIWCGPFRAETWLKYQPLHFFFKIIIGLSGVFNAFRYRSYLKPFSKNPFVRKYSVLSSPLNMLCRKYQPLCLIGQYVWTALSVATFAKIYKIPAVLDTHDIQAERAKSEKNAGLPQSFDFSWHDELALLELQDVLLAIQQKEALQLRHFVPNSQIILAEHPFESFDLPSSLPGDRRVLFVGSGALHNVHGIKKFIEVQWPKVRALVPDANLHIVGAVCNALDLEHVSESGIELAGVTSDLKNEYTAAAVIINPMLYGSGLKIKLIEAFAAGRAMVSTSIGAEGLEEASGKAFVEVAFENMHQEIVRLLTNYEERRRHENEAVLLLRKRFNPEVCFSGLSAYLQSLSHNI